VTQRIQKARIRLSSTQLGALKLVCGQIETVCKTLPNFL